MGHLLNLREYQSGAIQALRFCLARGVKRQVLYSPTGSGKTEMAMAIIAGAIAKGKRIVFLCNRIHLVGQASARFFRSGIAHGIIQGDNTRNIDAQVIVGSIQTVARRGMPDCDIIIIDEAHGVAGSKDFRNVIFQRSAVPVIGLSATPFARGMGKHYPELGGPLFEEMTVATSIQALIDENFLVDCDIYAPSEPDMSGIKQSKNAFGEMDWADSDVGRAVDKPQLIGDIVEHWLKLSKDLPTVCFASNIAHSKHIVESFRAAGVVAEHIDCYTDEDERKAILARVESGETTIISNVGILTEGWDFPACRTMILARPTKSLIRYIQMIGRVLRPHQTKERALVIDHSGTVQRLGFPTDDLPLELDDGRSKEASKPKAEEALPKKCPQCHCIKPPKVAICPKCGFQQVMPNTVESIDGELALVQKGKLKATAAEKQLFYSELLSLKGKRSDGWVAHAYKDKFGVWPRGMKDIPTEPRQETKNWITAKAIRFAKAKEAEARHAA
jgi:superfamily II DNA or RNA helicase